MTKPVFTDYSGNITASHMNTIMDVLYDVLGDGTSTPPNVSTLLTNINVTDSTTLAATYLTIATASATYLTIAAAASTYAPIASPTFTGTLAAPTINATTALQIGGADISTLYAPTASPAFTGTPTAPTAAADTNSTQIATTAFVQSTNTSLASATRDGSMSVTAASASGTYTASEIIVKTTLGGLSKVLSSYSQAINLATTGAGGMDTGSAPASGFVSLYAIYGTSGTSILACNVTTSTGEVYGGASMPAGYTYSALLGVWPTNGSSQFVAGLLENRNFYYQTFASIFTGGSQIATLTSQSISAAVPTNAKEVDVLIGYNAASTTAGPAAIAADGTGIGGKVATLSTAASQVTVGGHASYGIHSFNDVPIITSQTVYIAMPTTGTSYEMLVSGYEI